ncbi:MAG TPA: hypothetical protein VJT13_08025 [Xanthobacteraceae bacterium]|nr:hypothetical protein [Xanthobacteraceae bacterium]
MMLRSLPGIVAAALTLLAALAVGTFAALGEAKWSTYRSPTGFYNVDHPSGWRIEREENIVNIIADDGSGAVTISAYIGKRPASLKAEQLISAAFPTQQPTSPLLTVTGSGWKGIRRTFLDKSETPHHAWEIIVATNADGMVIITSNGASPRMTERAPVYTRIMQSLRLSKPKRG